MKAKMIAAIFIAAFALIAAFVFAGLYRDERSKTRLAYIEQYEYNITQAADELDVYLEKETDLDIHYNMTLSYIGTARSMVFLVDDYTEKQKTINELHYCFVKYPDQMKGKLKESSKALHDIADHLDKGYEEAQDIVDSIDKLGT